MKALVSIIIPVYNRGHLIGETLDSILAQTYSNWECIVVDDGSTDNTLNILKKYAQLDARIQYYQRPKDRPKGANSCRNYGFEYSRGNYINWLDSDDLIKRNAVQLILESFIDHVDLVVAPIKIFEKRENFIGEKKVKSNSLLEDYITNKVTFLTGGGYWKRKFLEQQKELFDESLGNLDDWDFNLRMLYKKPRIKFLDEALLMYRVHGDSLSHEINKLSLKEIQSEFKARAKHLLLLHQLGYKHEEKVLRKFIQSRYLFLLRLSLIEKSAVSYYLYKKLMFEYLKSKCFAKMVKVCVGFITFKTINKGYKLLS